MTKGRGGQGARWAGLAVLVFGLCTTGWGCGSNKNQTTAASAGTVTGPAVSIRLMVPPAMISSRVAKALSESRQVGPGKKVDPEKIPRYFHAMRLDSREPSRPVIFEQQFEPTSGNAQMQMPSKPLGGKGIWRVIFIGANQSLGALLPAFWWRSPAQGVALTPKSTLWMQVAEKVVKARPDTYPHPDVWALLQVYEFDPGQPGSSVWIKRRDQLSAWILKAMDRFPKGRAPAGSPVYAVLCALSITPLKGDKTGEIAARAVLSYHAELMQLAQRGLANAAQGKPMIRDESVVAPLAWLNSAPSSARDFAKNLQALEVLWEQAKPWPFEESPDAHEAALLSFEEARPPKTQPMATPPKKPVPPKPFVPVPPRPQPPRPGPALSPSGPLSGGRPPLPAVKTPGPASPSRHLSR